MYCSAYPDLEPAVVIKVTRACIQWAVGKKKLLRIRHKEQCKLEVVHGQTSTSCLHIPNVSIICQGASACIFFSCNDKSNDGMVYEEHADLRVGTGLGRFCSDLGGREIVD